MTERTWGSMLVNCTAMDPVLAWISITGVRHKFHPTQHTQGLDIALWSSPLANWKYDGSALRDPTAAPDEALVRIEPKGMVAYGQRATGTQDLINRNPASSP